MIRTVCALVLLLVGIPATACPICFQGMALSPAQQIVSAHTVAVLEQGSAGVVVLAAIKGDALTAPIAFGRAGLPDRPFLAIQPAPLAAWSVVGPVRVERAGVLRQVATGVPGVEASVTQWAAYVAFLLPLLDDTEPIIERIAEGELSRAPYAALRTLRPHLDAARHAGALDDPARQALHALLYGIAGGDPAPLERRIEDARRARDATNLAALLAAELEIRGPSRVAWIESSYLSDRSRTLPEIQAALLALSVHGEANAALRDRVVAAYGAFIKARPPMAAWVAADLARWGQWGAVPEYVRLLKGNGLPDPAGRAAIVAYLLQSPQAQSKGVRDIVAARVQ